MRTKSHILTLVMIGAVLFSGLLAGCGQQKVDNKAIPVKAGEHIIYGTYQGENIEWRVLDVDAEKGEVLLLSEYGIDYKPYHETQEEDIAWKDCTLRQWLNHDFFESAFAEEEREKIVLSASDGFPELNDKTPGGTYVFSERKAEDHVFLLSYTEVQKYLVDEDLEVEACYKTEFARSVSNPYRETCGWWLGSNYRSLHVPAVVPEQFGDISVRNIDFTPEFDLTNSKEYAVRPAMWIKW